MSAITAINMPKWGMEMSEGVISDWHAKPGDQVTEGADLVDIETSKIINTVTVPKSGLLRAIVAQSGETWDVGALLGVIAPAEVSDADIESFVAERTGGASADNVSAASSETVAEDAPAETPAVTATSMNVGDAGSPSASSQNGSAATASTTNADALKALGEGDDDSNVQATVIARRLAKQYGINLNNLTATGRHGRVNKADLEQAVLAAGGQLLASASSPNVSFQRDDSAVKATAVARRLAGDLGVNLLDCRASGDRGRVCKADVEAQAARQGQSVSASSVSAPVSDEAPESEAVAMTGMRKTIAARLQASKQTAPHFRVNVDVEIDNLLAARQQINGAQREAKVSVNDFIVKACACALQRYPAMNIQFDGETIRRFKHADISIAVAIDEGLITPIAKAVEGKGLITLSNEVRDLATRAKIGRLSPEEFQGGTFCVSNLGMYGIKSFDAIINPPQAAILAVGAGEQRPVVKGGELTVATVMSLSLSSDHRVIDGALAAEFMQCLKGLLEQPATMLG